MKIEQWPIEKPIPYARNARKISQAAVDKVAASIKEFGWRQPIVVDGEGVIIAGHTRLQAAQKLSFTQVPVHVAEGLTKAQVRAYRLMDNRSNDEAQWDKELLGPELQELTALGLDLALTGFDPAELANYTVEKCEGLVDEDQTPEALSFAISEPGDLWILGNHRLLCGDSTSIDAVERLMDGGLADVIFTDPPYGYKFESNHYKDGNPHGMLKNDDKVIDFLPNAYAFAKEDSALFVCASHQTAHEWRVLIDQYFTYKNLIVWKKNNWSMGDLEGAFAGQHELIFFAHKGRVKLRGERSRDVWEFDREPPKDHPTQKPVELVAFALDKTSDESANVLDLFGGSGSTLIACETTNRKARLMELDPKYCDVIVKRWQDFTGKTAHLEDGTTFVELEAKRNKKKPNKKAA